MAPAFSRFAHPCTYLKCNCTDFKGSDDDDECHRCAHTPARHPEPSSSKATVKSRPKFKIRDLVAKKMKVSPDSKHADKEANDGLVPSTQKKPKRRSGHFKAKDERRIMGIIFNPWGTVADESGVVEIIRPVAISPGASLPMYDSIGLAYTDKNGVNLDLSMDHSELAQFLRTHIPAFGYLMDSVRSDEDEEKEELPNWAACNYFRDNLTFGVEPFPDAQALYAKCSSSTKQWSEQYIYIVSIDAIGAWEMFPFSGVKSEDVFRRRYNQLIAHERRREDFLNTRDKDEDNGSQASSHQ
ncbi:hypothetical protein AAF712_016298 [Marasmius tenuissimus]|uniref:Uncharacterized protein n=1 Tax=Marasmius tenuissimus TaxID=585030 RepID=A0ABR2Z753_9AGAR